MTRYYVTVLIELGRHIEAIDARPSWLHDIAQKAVVVACAHAQLAASKGNQQSRDAVKVLTEAVMDLAHVCSEKAVYVQQLADIVAFATKALEQTPVTDGDAP